MSSGIKIVPSYKLQVTSFVFGLERRVKEEEEPQINADERRFWVGEGEFAVVAVFCTCLIKPGIAFPCFLV